MSGADLQIIVLARPGAAALAGAPEAPVRPAGGALLPLALSRATAVAGHAVTAVLGAQAGDLAPALGRLPVSLVVNRQWRAGLVAAIRAGLHSLPGSCSGALLWPADQSGVTTADLQRLIDAGRRNPRTIVAAQCGGRHGLPAIFPRHEFRCAAGAARRRRRTGRAVPWSGSRARRRADARRRNTSRRYWAVAGSGRRGALPRVASPAGGSVAGAGAAGAAGTARGAGSGRYKAPFWPHAPRDISAHAASAASGSRMRARAIMCPPPEATARASAWTGARAAPASHAPPGKPPRSRRSRNRR